MTVVSSWHLGDKPQSRINVTRELLVLWVVHLHRSYRIIRGTPTA